MMRADPSGNFPFHLLIGCVIGGIIGGKGANHKNTLTKTITTAKDALKREGRRANKSYAAKAITKVKYSRNFVISDAFWTSTAKFFAGSGISSGLNTWYGNNRFFNA